MDLKLNCFGNPDSAARSRLLDLKQGSKQPDDHVIQSEFKRIHYDSYSMVMKDQAEHLRHQHLYSPRDDFNGDLATLQKNQKVETISADFKRFKKEINTVQERRSLV